MSSKSQMLLLAVLIAALLAPIGPAAAQAASGGPDLGIGNGVGNRPNILVAWRNTERILEIEVLVRNLGDEPGRGDLFVELCDEAGRPLASTDATAVTVPARQNGGESGVIVQSKGFRLMNMMFDQLDRLDQRYKLRARIESVDGDLNPADNVAAKAFNIDSRALPGTKSFHRYHFTNTSAEPIEAKITLEHNSLPEGWTFEAAHGSGSQVALEPGELLTGHLVVETPERAANGEYLDFLISMVDASSGRVVDKDEWFLVVTDELPLVDQPTATVRTDGTVVVNAVAHDPICGIKEASGVQVFYSLDDGVTFSTRVMAYVRGNFYDKTWFEGVLGPFAPGTEVTPVVTVTNNAGLHRRFELEPVTIGASPATGANSVGGGL